MGGSAKKPMKALATGGMSMAKDKHDDRKTKTVTQTVTTEAPQVQTAEDEETEKKKRQSIFTAEGGNAQTANNRGTVFGN